MGDDDGKILYRHRVDYDDDVVSQQQHRATNSLCAIHTYTAYMANSTIIFE